jgi:hypothetical protein
MGPDTTIIDNPKKTMISAKLFGAAYSRPEEVRSPLPMVYATRFFVLSKFFCYPILFRMKSRTVG